MDTDGDMYTHASVRMSHCMQHLVGTSHTCHMPRGILASISIIITISIRIDIGISLSSSFDCVIIW